MDGRTDGRTNRQTDTIIRSLIAIIIILGKDGQTILKIKEAGSNFGLHLILNVQQQEYFGLQSYLAGLRILIHHQQTLPLVSQLGFAVGPGTSTFAAIRKQRVTNLCFLSYTSYQVI